MVSTLPWIKVRGSLMKCWRTSLLKFCKFSLYWRSYYIQKTGFLRWRHIKHTTVSCVAIFNKFLTNLISLLSLLHIKKSRGWLITKEKNAHRYFLIKTSFRGSNGPEKTLSKLHNVWIFSQACFVNFILNDNRKEFLQITLHNRLLIDWSHLD